MNYKEAIALAKEGREEGFRFLYDNTYKSKYYLALKYMNNEEAAQDILQEAYMKAFSKLDTLDNPEAFPGWLGVIVGNLAKNALQKKNPLLFSDVSTDDDNQSFELEIEDEKTDQQPELSYSKQETQELVHEMINSLSEEQRVCILMFEIEGIPIKEIAAALQCSENTVKSRLNYGRKNLKRKAEEMQKKGYKLYGLAPLPLLLSLLYSEQKYFYEDGILNAAQSQASQQFFSQFNPAKSSNFSTIQNAAHEAVKSGTNIASTAAKSGFIHTIAGKIAVGIIGVSVACGSVYGVAQISNAFSKDPVTESSIVSQAEPSELPELSAVEPEVKQLANDDYETLIAGNLTKQELEYVLAYGPSEIPPQGFQSEDYFNLLNSLCHGSPDTESPIKNYGYTPDYINQYSLKDVNRFFSSFTDFQFTDENDREPWCTVIEDSDLVKFSPATLNYVVKSTITSSEYTDQEITLYFTYNYHLYDNLGKEIQTQTNKKAILHPTSDGKFRIVKIEEVGEENPDEQTNSNQPESTPTTENPHSEQEFYADVLESIKNQEPGYEIPDQEEASGDIQYFFYDIDKDGIQELILSTESTVDLAFIGINCWVYSCEKTDNGYSLKPIEGSIPTLNLRISQDKDGLITEHLGRMNGMYSHSRITIVNGALKTESLPEYEFRMDDAYKDEFEKNNPEVQWQTLK